MTGTLATFEDLAAKAKAGDEDALRTFRDEAARLFPADFGPGGQHCDDLLAGGPDGLDRALAIIRQTSTTGG